MEKNRRKHIICPCCEKPFDETEATVVKRKDEEDVNDWKYCPHCNRAIHIPQAQAIQDYFDEIEEEIKSLREGKYLEYIKYVYNLTENKEK